MGRHLHDYRYDVTFGILALTQLYNWFGPVSLPECDDSGVQSTIRNIFREKAKVEIAVMDAFTPAPIAADGLSCTADLTFSDKARARLSYRVVPAGRPCHGADR